jgi:hypothetical protein
MHPHKFPRSALEAWLLLAVVVAVGAWVMLIVGGFAADLSAMFLTWTGGICAARIWDSWVHWRDRRSASTLTS